MNDMENLPKTKASIIIISHNNLKETTEPCLQSIFEKTSGSFEVICVDNASKDGTRDYLSALAKRNPGLRLIFNETNRGFAGGNNDGIRAAKGDFIILLNSDTIVTERWLEKLTGVLENDKTAGLVGPVSNSVGNEQQIYVRSNEVETVLKEGAHWCSMSKGGLFETDKLGFFCVAARTDVLDNVGLLDEGYGLGYYEDDDYCIRTKKAGYRLICAEDIFIYHKGSGSFTDSKSTKDLMRRNRKLLEAKLDCKAVQRHPRDLQLHVIETYIEKAKTGGLTPELSYRIENRLQAIDRKKPKSLLKRISLHFKIQGIKNKVERMNRQRSFSEQP